MALSGKIGGLSTQLLKNKTCLLYAATRYASDKERLPWNYLWRAGPHSEKNYDKIAEKYHLHPDDYKPYSKEEGYGDYPKLPMVGPIAKDPYYPYDIPLYKKNYHEPLHIDFELMGEDRYDYGRKHRINPAVAISIFFATIIGLGIIRHLLEPYPTFIPRMEKQYPQKGVVHYTFEPVDSK
ncbi:NADH dehydrogenase [ubiquinone] 1 beta subcomplex subunit 8, mitochondrial [Pogonomyrmex barbatus]|uniref:NADH dehydrogenase [ubiquinone] 1 beta subcomplex subunit 8, mitochondrial n=1 Tax=Pogonomyrmex barbatus TaxID=144034 RepID=A0A6I9VUT5_9HYME|nr:NADH dehydrogenase [ubiquinone] 1 beta subcomplex subunit 8, mitochondrial [Pogonomyrmex barbatus]